MQIIHDSTGGRVPRYWRPPFGDTDNRVRAIAKEVFGLTTVIWNQDSQDWTMDATPPGTNLQRIQDDFTTWLNGPRSPGLIVLEHEITPGDVTAFINMYPLIAAASASGQGEWKAVSVSQLFDGHETGWDGEGWYLNADNNTAPVSPMEVVGSGYGGAGAAAPTGVTTANNQAPTPTTTLDGGNRGAAMRNSVGVAGTAGVAGLIALLMSFAL